MTTASPLIPVDLFAAALHLRGDGEVRAAGSREASPDPGTWHLAAFRAETDADVHADHWETHPAADETVCCLTGGLRLHLRPAGPGGTEPPLRLGPGTAAVIPRGRWHRLELDAPSDLLTLTVRDGTRLEPRGDATEG